MYVIHRNGKKYVVRSLSNPMLYKDKYISLIPLLFIACSPESIGEFMLATTNP